ncbi:homeobox-leucine zipper protein HDG2-like isoform X2 [Papaver somniferum]|uniref:homeobox-leucine zipper protein HDG2-like isoform X2 n=1 Tax=Papaver somniferum TaxID=3469 RepID=UPI000E6FAFFE|nr:homeobox-leucine zipper protein HDG2-like isoform X2 [Papaver somniferum]
MPAGIMLPARHVPPTMGNGNRNGNVPEFGSSSSGLTLGQTNMMDAHHLLLHHQHSLLNNPLDMMNQTTPESNDLQAARIRAGDEEFDSKSGGSDNLEGTGGGSGDEQLDQNQRKRKKRYHRHTQHQIQEMESFFKECPHPDDKQRKELGRELGLEPLQVKFWFQNKRTQMKNQHERHENNQLRAENDKLRAENIRYKEALSTASCPNCGGPTALGEMSFDEHHLRMENVRLREEIDKISGIAAKYVGKPMMPYPISSPLLPPRMLDLGVGHLGIHSHSGSAGGEIFGSSDDLMRSLASGHTDLDKSVVVELAVAAMEELVQLSQLGEPIWVQRVNGESTETLNEEEYARTFPRGIGSKPFGFKTEASRDSALVIMNCMNLVESLMDANQWMNLFSGIVSRAVILEILSTGVAGNSNGALQLMTGEFQVASPLVPTRESLFVRYCKQQGESTWAVVDVSLDHLRSNNPIRFRRRPSGCIIQDMPNGYSKVTWVEHVEVDDRAVHELYRPLVNSTIAFGAKRWLAVLDRQCERLASAMASNIPAGEIGVITTPDGRKMMLKLAERMATSFCAGVGASSSHTWTIISGNGADDVRVMTRKSVDDPGRPPGIVLNAATSFWIPVPPKRIFDFLRHENSRSEWDILSNGGIVEEIAHIANGRDPGNCVSLLRVNQSTNSSQSNMLILQESCTEATGSFVIYAPVDIPSMNDVINGGNPDNVALLPSGFAILPDGPITHHGDGQVEYGQGGSLLTVAFQILVDSVPTAKLALGSVATVNSLITCTVDRIKAAVTDENA